MPSGNGSGIVHSASFTPTFGGTLIVTCTYTNKSSGSDWGSAVKSSCFVTQNGVTAYGPLVPAQSVRTPQTVKYSFTVAANLAIEAGLYGTITGASQGDWWDIDVTLELIKR